MKFKDFNSLLRKKIKSNYYRLEVTDEQLNLLHDAFERTMINHLRVRPARINVFDCFTISSFCKKDFKIQKPYSHKLRDICFRDRTNEITLSVKAIKDPMKTYPRKKKNKVREKAIKDDFIMYSDKFDFTKREWNKIMKTNNIPFSKKIKIVSKKKDVV